MKRNVVIFTVVALCLCACTHDNSETFSTGDLYKSKNIVAKAAELGLSAEEYSKMPEKVLKHREASMKLADYVELKERTFYLTISKQKAETLGVSGEQYDVVVKDLNATNAAIREAMENGDTLDLSGAIEELRTTISNIRKGAKGPSSLETISDGDNQKQSGRIETTSSDFGTDSFYPPNYKNRVIFTCMTKAAFFPVYTCKTKVFGEFKAVTSHGSFGKNTTIEVPLAASGAMLCAELFFKTTDSSGGIAAWKAE